MKIDLEEAIAHYLEACESVRLLNNTQEAARRAVEIITNNFNKAVSKRIQLRKELEEAINGACSIEGD